MHTTWEFSGRTFELDLDDIFTLSKYDAALKAQNAAFAALPPGATDAAQLIAYCDGIRALIDALFGEGVTDELLSGSVKPSDFDTLYESFKDFLHEQTEANAKRRAEIIAKYRPDPNREQRRAIEQVVKKAAKSAAKKA